jgi:hypothetical protein
MARSLTTVDKLVSHLVFNLGTDPAGYDLPALAAYLDDEATAKGQTLEDYLSPLLLDVALGVYRKTPVPQTV